MAAQYAFVMKDMTKSFPGAQKPVLSNINLQFYHGAKIGIVGPNGAGKSTLMKIMAGIDRDFQDQVREMLKPGTSALFLILEKATPDKAIAAMSKFGGTVLKSSLSEDAEHELQDALHGQQPVGAGV